MSSGTPRFEPLGLVGEAVAATIRAHERFGRDGGAALVAAAEATASTLGRGGKLLVFGNGGSAADAQHLAAELVGRFLRDRRALPAVALTTDTSVMTSVANDYGYDRVFARQVEALGHRGDVAMGITTSGGSPNVIAAFAASRERGLTTIAVTGRDGGDAGRAADLVVNVNDESTPRIQEVHRTILHVFCDLVERFLDRDGKLTLES